MTAEPKKIKGLNLGGDKLSLTERREIESLGPEIREVEGTRQGACAAAGRKARAGSIVKHANEGSRLEAHEPLPFKPDEYRLS
jgi:hypothetical protein